MKRIFRILPPIAGLLLLSSCGAASRDDLAADTTVIITETTETTAATVTTATTAATSKTTETTASVTTAAQTETTVCSSETTTASVSARAAVTTAPAVPPLTTAPPQTTVPVTTAPPDCRTQMDKLIKKYNKNCAVLVYSMDGETLYSYHPDTAISGASLIKLPYVYYCCTQLSAGVRSLDETITYTSSWYHGGAGIIRLGGYGKVYTISQLIDYAMRYSDNVAYDMLVYLFGIDGFNAMVRSWGYSVSISQNTRFPSVTAAFMRTSMENMQKKSNAGECWRIAWSALVNSVKSYVRDTIGNGNDIAVKYGSIPAQYHEVCYVDGAHPYILVILSGATNYTPDVTFVQNVASCAQEIADAYAASLTTTTTTTTTTTMTTTTTTTTTTTAATTVTTSITAPIAASSDTETETTAVYPAQITEAAENG